MWNGQIIKILLGLRNKIPLELPEIDFAIISKKIGKTILTEEDLNKELKKYKSEPAIKKTIDIGEDGLLTPRGFTKEEKDLVREIDASLYKHETIIELMKYIGKNKIKSSDDFP